jgi:beta-glucosidase
MLSAILACAVHAHAYPWCNRKLAPDVRARLVEQRMTVDEMLRLVDGKFAEWATFMPGPHNRKPAGAIGSAGFVPGVPRLGIPDLQESDAGLGVADPMDAGGKPIRGKAGYSIALPAGLATAATWNPSMAYAGGSMIGREAHEEGFNVLLAGGIDLARDPRNGRNFEYAGEDPLLAGTIAGNAIAGIQHQHVISTIKHYAFNDQETNRGSVNAVIDPAPARESDLLAFEVALEIGNPGSVMCSYNRVNSVYACQNDDLLNRTLKHDWRYPGFVMSDWGAVHQTSAALAGLDQESGDYLDERIYFGDPLKKAIASKEFPLQRLHDMAHRILRSMFANGVFDDPPVVQPIDANADAAVSQQDEEQGAVLLRNSGILPITHNAASIAVIGMHADRGVLSGGGSSQVWPAGGPAVEPGNSPWPGPMIWDPSSPLDAIRAEVPKARLTFYGGNDVAEAKRYARSASIAIVFAYQWLAESIDAANLSLPNGQDALIMRVARANPNTIVVLETGDPVTMPWLSQTRAVLEAWYPGSAGGKAIARLLFGDVSPSGRLPITFPANLSQLPRPSIDSKTADYNLEGSDVGYRWFQRRSETPLFPFGYGLTYTTFRYSRFQIHGGKELQATFNVTNSGARTAVDVPQLYVALPQISGTKARRLAGWQRVNLRAGETRSVTITVDPRILARFDDRAGNWRVFSGRYTFYLGASALDLRLSRSIELSSKRLAP